MGAAEDVNSPLSSRRGSCLFQVALNYSNSNEAITRKDDASLSLIIDPEL